MPPFNSQEYFNNKYCILTMKQNNPFVHSPAPQTGTQQHGILPGWELLAPPKLRGVLLLRDLCMLWMVLQAVLLFPRSHSYLIVLINCKLIVTHGFSLVARGNPES